MNSLEALTRLKDGNRRFSANVRSNEPMIGAARRAETAEGQNPFAIVLGCSDSRVPAEIVFDQGLGDLFVIRVAGNIVAPSQLGSIEFAIEHFGTNLVVVLGHSRCGAITATLDAIQADDSAVGPMSRNVASIVDRILPAMSPLARALPGGDRESLIAAGVRANVQASVNHIRHGTVALERMTLRNELLIVGAEYDLASGEVTFFED
jgi:carbonic anhydrase